MKVAEVGTAWRSGADPESLLDREWLITNGLGGYGSGTVLGPHTRKYHGLFVPNLSDPNGRHVLLSALDEQIEFDDSVVRLGGHEDLAGQFHTDAHQMAGSFSLDASMPVWRQTHDAFGFTRRLLLPYMQNLLCAQYGLSARQPVAVKIRPHFTLRRHDTGLDGSGRDRGDYSVEEVSGHAVLQVTMHDHPVVLRCTLVGVETRFIHAPLEVTHRYRQETQRGYSDNAETHFSPGYFLLEGVTALDASLLVTTQPIDLFHVDVAALFEAEQTRVANLVAAAGVESDPFAARLVIAADQFVIRPGNRPEEIAVAEASGTVVRTVIAGYHWFGDWGRDTMISLEGLTLSTGRLLEAAAILETFAGYVKDGLLPNLFPEGQRAALYHTVDATLWFFHSIDCYTRRSGDASLVARILPVLESIIEHYHGGTHYGIAMDPADALVRAGAPGYQLTWMDAKAGDWMVTPRHGKPVEIQALWYNALCLMAGWTADHGGSSRLRYEELAARVKASFNARYPLPAGSFLYDVIDGPQGDDASGRPNQIFAISLPHPVLDEGRWATVLDYVTRQLLTPYGLRTLSPDHPDFKRNYHGDLLTRDGAYHQGTVWPWLIGHYADAWARVNAPCAPQDCPDVLGSFAAHLSEFGMGSIAEIFDAERPFVPRGCIAQAWSVAEVLRTRKRFSVD
ncbi:MAG: amylo-alpha-1,6-glucosidase [Steroidobacteraceae bacterium]